MGDIAQVITGDGEYCRDELAQYVGKIGLASCQTNYQVVAIMGPQSSGKSTLLNHVFGTDFKMMDAMVGRGQTTKGLWVSKSPKLSEITTLVMDLEGSDGRERGEDDTNFERQSALFALSVADILLVNVWCHDIGREHGSGKPLLKTIFQVNLKLFAPDVSRKRTVLLFVIRDKTKTPLPKLVEVLEADLNKMWESIAKPPQYVDTSLQQFFEVQYAGLSHFEERYDDFVADANVLRRRFDPEAEDTLYRGHEKLPGDSFVLNTQELWAVIRSQKDLNLPAHKIMVAGIRCQQMVDEQMASFTASTAWSQLQAEALSGGVVQGFGNAAAQLMNKHLEGYDSEARYFDSAVQAAKRSELLRGLLAEVQPAYAAQARAQADARLTKLRAIAASELPKAAQQGALAACAAELRSQALTSYASAMREHVEVPGSAWDSEVEVAAFAKAVDSAIGKVRGSLVSELLSGAEKQVRALTGSSVMELLASCTAGVWPRMHEASANALQTAEEGLQKSLAGYALQPAEASSLHEALAACASGRLDTLVRDAALTRITRMTDRFQAVFTRSDSGPRVWGARDDVHAHAAKARAAAARVLATLTYMRPAGQAEEDDIIGASVLRMAADDSDASATSASLSRSQSLSDSATTTSSCPSSSDTTGSSSNTTSNGFSTSNTALAGIGRSVSGGRGAASGAVLDLHTLTAWPGVEPGAVLLRPAEVRATWAEFGRVSDALVQQALMQQQSNKLAHSRPLPLWAGVMMAVLGWNELMALLFSPFYLLLIVLLGLFGYSLYRELDVEREMSRGALPGALSLAHKLGPACKRVVNETAHSIRSMLAEAQGHESPGGGSSRGRGSCDDDAALPARAANYRTAGAGAGGQGLTRRNPSMTGGEVDFTNMGAAMSKESRKDH